MKRILAVGLSCLVIPACGCNNHPSAARSAPPVIVQSNVAPPPDAPPPQPVDVQAGSSIGPVQIGSTRAAVEALGLDAHPTSDPDTIVYGPYTVHFASGAGVDRVEVPLSARSAPLGFTLYGRPLPSDSTSLQRVLDAIGDCAAPEVVEGGTVARCHRGKLTVLQSSAGGPLTLRVARLAEPPAAPAVPSGAPVR